MSFSNIVTGFFCTKNRQVSYVVMMFNIEDYLKTDFVGASQSDKVNAYVDEFRNHLASLSERVSITFTVALCGSYGSGLASRSDSLVDVIVKLDGKATRGLDKNMLAQIVELIIQDWSIYENHVRHQDDADLIICNTKVPGLTLRISVCTSSLFDIEKLFHVRLFHSYANSHTRVPIFISAIKRWARSHDLSLPVVKESCPFSGFHWTIVGLAFLIEQQVVPNLHELARASSDIPRMQFGANKDIDVFALIENPSHVSTGHEVGDLFIAFLEWLSQTDLLTREIDLRAITHVDRQPSQRGYLVINNPCKVNAVNTVNASFHQRHQIVFGLKIRRAASDCLDTLKKSRSISKLLYPPSGVFQRIDIAVP